jgi:CRP-like cAMP-binding protein
MIKLEDKIKSLFNLDAESLEIFASLFSDLKIKKSDFFAKKGEYSKKIAFVESGILRAFYSNDRGEEYNKTFFTEGSFVGAYSSLVSGEQNLIDIDCLTDCSLYVAEFQVSPYCMINTQKLKDWLEFSLNIFFVRKEKKRN